MIANATPSPIALSRWTAKFLRPAAAGGWAEGHDQGSVRIGPVTIFEAGAGCHYASFGPGNANVAVFDGYLFDRDALAADVGRGPTSSPAEILAGAFERWGADCLRHVDGSYLAAIWDAGAGRFLLGHDPLGRHPAFYAVAGDAFWFGPNVLTVGEPGHVSRQVNRLSLALLSLRYWPAAGETYFQSIRRVQPGHYVSLNTTGAVSETKYWDLFPTDDEPWLPESQVIEEFEPSLAKAVARCMALSPQGIMLSGGVDSVTVAALAADYGRRHGVAPLVGVSGRSGGPLSYEEKMQAEVTQALAMPHLISTTPEWRAGRDPIELSLEATDQMPGPGGVYWLGTYTAFYRTAARSGNAVLLTGSGGDDWLRVADVQSADLLRRLKLRQLASLVWSDLATGGRPARRTLRNRLWSGGVRPYVDVLMAQLAPSSKARHHRRKWDERLPKWLCPDAALREALLDDLMSRRAPELTATGQMPRSIYRHAMRSYVNPFRHHEAETAFHVDALCGLRLLSPYHDRRLVEFFTRISPMTLAFRGRYKGLLRPVAQRHLPGLGLERQRKYYAKADQEAELRSFQTSMARAFRGARFDALEDLGILDTRALAAEGGAIEAMQHDRLTVRFALLSAERWTSVQWGIAGTKV